MRQLRISKFLCQVSLTQNQRELVKFQKPYTLYSRLPNKTATEAQQEEASKKTPFEDLLEFKPRTNTTDNELFKGILGEDALKPEALE